MSQGDLKHQMELADKHRAKADQCHEYGKYDDALVHQTIAAILQHGVVEAFDSKEFSWDQSL